MTAVRWSTQFSSSAPPRSPAPPFDHFPFGPAILRRRVPSGTYARVRRNFSPWPAGGARVRKRREEMSGRRGSSVGIGRAARREGGEKAGVGGTRKEK